MKNSVKVRRNELNMSQVELALKANVSRQTLSLIENNKLDNIESKTMLKIAIALKCDIGDIFFKENVVFTQQNTKLKNLLQKYEIENIDDFEPTFYYQNIVNGYQINRRAVSNLLDNYSKEDLIKIENYDEIGIVEYVANNQYHIEDNKIIVEE